MIPKIALVLLSSFFLKTHDVKHDFYVSVTSIRHNAEKQNLSIRIKLFANDFEKSFVDEKGFGLGILKKSPNKNAKQHIEKYIFSKFSIIVNEKLVNMSFVEQKFENTERVEEDLIICKLEASNIPKIDSIKIKNQFLTESFDSQTNIVFIIANGMRKTLNLDRKISEGEISFN
tara:strand:- start:5126 stop:5647 length:522 start_codon:yes stop_codon:yes gene_type:complete